MRIQNCNEKIYVVQIKNMCYDDAFGRIAITINSKPESGVSRYKPPIIYIVSTSLSEASKKLEEKGIHIKAIEELTDYYISDNMDFVEETE